MPVFFAALTLRGLPVVVVGGGSVAARKVATLRRADALVRVVAPDATPGIRKLARQRRLRWIRSPYRPGFLKGAWLVVTATSDPATNARVARDAARRHLFANVADDPATGTVLFPAIVRRGPIQVAVSTGGESPGLAALLRDRLARRITPVDADLARLIGAVRRRLQSVVTDPRERRRRLQRLPRLPIRSLLRSGRWSEARRVARRAAGLR